ncbi:hypothetical protein EGX35_14675 [Clavibacter nebraskensis]|uniref:Uncharacterized protein n=1 Tax=Clavibacter nebraskensis TaxID=31963 RepID=A0ABY4MWX0_9MICO|nr:hypothetical protein [Clavibacter nebraskensis]KXU21984.1 hypothetical protein VV38_01290 [Clavibacter nebraskensis]OAH18758.1 hypothetical protein A3Q38_09950 [Clavibacter nebraskensis]QKO03335.1 hypothetical protein EGX35_14675 [Clavibacter nebraskensis]QLL36483.1 hypothetical protein EGX36_14725 [Clavibacter nebraskensis]QLL36586.1 hypothetical protein EGX37_14675 [Clavibacter nebraskensis]
MGVQVGGDAEVVLPSQVERVRAEDRGGFVGEPRPDAELHLGQAGEEELAELFVQVHELEDLSEGGTGDEVVPRILRVDLELPRVSADAVVAAVVERAGGLLVGGELQPA